MHSNAPLTPYLIQLGCKLYPLIEGDVSGTIIQNGKYQFMCQRPGVLLIIQPGEKIRQCAP